MLKSTCLAAAAALTLSSCQTTGDIDTSIQKSLPQICSGAEIGYTGVVEPLVGQGVLKPKVENAAVAAYVSIQTLCNDPSKATLASTLFAATSATLAISIAVRDAKRLEESK